VRRAARRDANHAAVVADLLVELAAATGGMLVVVTHAEAVAARVAAGPDGDRVRLVEGRIVP
jgi:predicted ABC-type transport system involved in lysophospholipase L1 biosynthesis ATPase subunit